MTLRNSVPLQFSPYGVTDAIDGTNVRPGAMAMLTNLIPDATTKDIWTCRPASVLLSTLANASPGNTQGFVSAAIQVGTRIYGMVSSSKFGTTDIPFSYNVLTNTFDTITGMTAANTPTSPPTSGPWTPPTMALIGPYVVVTHPGFNFSGGFAFGALNISNPLAPVWQATNTTTNALVTLPNFVANFNGRAYFLQNPVGAQPSALFTDIDNPLTATGNGPVITSPTTGLPIPQPVVPIITFDDNEPLVSLATLGLFNQLGGVVQALIVFKGVTNIYQITGDIAQGTGFTGTLSKNALNVATGTQCPLAVASTPKGLAFLAPDGLRLIDFYARISDPIGIDGEGVNQPFLNIAQPSRAQASCNQTVLRVSIQNNAAGGAAQDWWYDVSRSKWSGPHTFPAAQIVPFGATFIMTPIGVNGALFQSDVVQSAASTFVENGKQMVFSWTTCMLPDPKQMAYFSTVESTLNMALVSQQPPVTITALDQNGVQLGQVFVSAPQTGALWGQFNWGQAQWAGGSNALFPRPMEWTQPIVARRWQINATGNCVAGLKIGDLFMRYRVLGYMIVDPASTQSAALPNQGDLMAVNTIAALRAFAIPSGPLTAVAVLGYYAAGDGGGGTFWFNPTDVSQDNGGTIIAPNVGPGRWHKLNTGRNFRAIEWGVSGAVADNYPLLAAFRDFARADTGPWSLTFDPATYRYSKNYWAKGINNFTINGAGSIFACSSTSPFFFDQVDLSGNDGLFTPWGYNTYSPATNFGFQIASATANGSSVTTLVAGNAANFAVGNRVLIWGFGTQNGGFPPNPRYWEWNTVVSVNPSTGVIGLLYPLRNSYDQNWHTYAVDGTGSPFITNISRADFNQCQRLTINGGYWGNGKPAGQTGLQLQGYDHVELNDLEAEYLDCGNGGRFELNRCILHAAEVDKIGSSFTVNGGQIQGFQQGSGFEEIVLRGGVVMLGNTLFAPHRLIVDGAHFANNNSGEAAVVAIGDTFPMIGVDIRQARFTIWDSNLKALLEAGSTTSFTISSVVSNTKVLVACANDTAFQTVYQTLRIGFTYQLANGSKRMRITRIYDNDATHVAIEGTFTDVPLAAEIYVGSLIAHTNLGDIVQDGPFAPLPVMQNTSDSPALQHIEARDRYSEKILLGFLDIPVPASGGGNTPRLLSIEGWIRKIVVNVSKAYSGADGSSSLIIADGSLTTYESIDTKTTGIREITPNAYEGGAGSDNLNVLSFAGVYFDTINIYITQGGNAPHYTDPTQLAKFSIHIETQKES